MQCRMRAGCKGAHQALPVQLPLACKPVNINSFSGALIPQAAPLRRLVVVEAAPAKKGFGTAPKQAVQPAQPVQSEPCPCESGRSYKKCCEPLHKGSKSAATPEAALRARFAAFTKGEAQYVVQTTHPEYYTYHYNKPQAEVEAQYLKDVQEGCSKYVYVDLKITQNEPGSSDDEGFVSFTYKSARKTDDGSAIPEASWTMTQEKCRFLKNNGQWQFADYQNYDYNINKLITEVEQTQAATKQ